MCLWERKNAAFVFYETNRVNDLMTQSNDLFMRLNSFAQASDRPGFGSSWSALWSFISPHVQTKCCINQGQKNPRSRFLKWEIHKLTWWKVSLQFAFEMKALFSLLEDKYFCVIMVKKLNKRLDFKVVFLILSHHKDWKRGNSES